MSANTIRISDEEQPSVEPVETGEKNTELNQLNSPLQNPLIINHIFNLLEFKELKQCHLVCRKWNQLSISFLEKMSVVTLGYPQFYETATRYSPKTFKEFSQISAVNFRAFKLASCRPIERCWPSGNVIEFLQDHRETLQELIIENIHVVGYYKRSRDYCFKDYFDITPHIGNQLTHMSIINMWGSKFIVDTNKLTSLKSISLAHCALAISENCILSPEKFELDLIAFVKCGNKVPNFLINDLLDFENLKELTIDGKMGTAHHFLLRITEGSSISLDLAGNVKLDNLSLKCVTLNNFEDSNWEISGKLTLRRIPFKDTKAGMKFSELDFGHSTINLDLLPESLEKLTLSEIDPDLFDLMFVVIDTPLFSLPNLKYLQLLTYNSCPCRRQDEENEEGHDNDSAESVDDEDSDDDEVDFPGDPSPNALRWLDFFVDCPNLTTVRLTSEKGRLNYPSQLLQTEWLPERAENIFLNGNIIALGEEFQFNKLVIENNNLQFLTKTLKGLKSKHLVLNLNSESLGKFSKFSQLQKILLKLIKMPYKSLAIGSLKLKMDIPAFNKTSFFNFVDERADYYLFNNQEGKAIKEWEFRKMLEQ